MYDIDSRSEALNRPIQNKLKRLFQNKNINTATYHLYKTQQPKISCLYAYNKIKMLHPIKH